ncbi:MAG: DinB family protein [Litorilinea sp.]
MGKSMTWLYRHNLWANLRLLDRCAELSDGQLDLVGPGTYGTVRDTLVHLFAAEQRYVEALRLAPYAEPWRESQGFPGFDYLRRSAQYTGESLIEIAENVAHDEFRTGTYRGGEFAMPAAVFLVQSLHHAMEHRSHIVSILSPQGVELPHLDGWSFEDEIRATLAQEQK